MWRPEILTTIIRCKNENTSPSSRSYFLRLTYFCGNKVNSYILTLFVWYEQASFVYYVPDPKARFPFLQIIYKCVINKQGYDGKCPSRGSWVSGRGGRRLVIHLISFPLRSLSKKRVSLFKPHVLVYVFIMWLHKVDAVSGSLWHVFLLF